MRKGSLHQPRIREEGVKSYPVIRELYQIANCSGKNGVIEKENSVTDHADKVEKFLVGVKGNKRNKKATRKTECLEKPRPVFIPKKES